MELATMSLRPRVRDRAAKLDKPAVRIMPTAFQVTQIATVYVSCLSAVFVFVTLVFADMI